MRKRTLAVLALAVAGWVVSGPGAWAAIYTGGAGDCWSMGAMTNDVHLGGAVVTLSSAANQSFSRGYAPVAISTITIADDITPGIKNGTPIAVRIPADFAMTWDETDLTPTFGGTAAGKVGAISYTNSNKRLVIAVTMDFVANDTLTISALSFKNHLGYGSARLELDFDNDGAADAQDDTTITILGVFQCGGLGDSYAFDEMSYDKLLLRSGTIFIIR